jgi:peptidoglycan/LPS O-acetylase OafA/YrhL
MSFHTLRHLAALLVIVGHSFELTRRATFGVIGDPMGVMLGTETIAGSGVIIFFAISGYFVTQSAMRSKNMFEFLWKRGLRIIPAFWVMIAVVAFVVGPLVTTLSFQEYFSHRELQRFLMSLFFKLGGILPGVFVENPYSGIVNGSLWSLPLEVKCYLMVAVLSVFGLIWLRKLYVMAAIAMFIVFALLFVRAPFIIPIFRVDSITFVKLVTPFLIGAAVAIWAPTRFASARLSLAALVCVSVLSYFIAPLQKWSWLLFALSLAWCALSAGLTVQRERRTNSLLEKPTDISYGMYLWAFPVQQTLIAQITSISFFFLFLGTLAIVLPIAYASWRWVEKPMLAEKQGFADWFPFLATPRELKT